MKRMLFVLAVLLWMGTACDDGKIYETYQQMEEQGCVYKLTANLIGVDTWPDDYELVAAAFGDSPYATYTKVIHALEREGESVSVILSGVREVSQVAMHTVIIVRIVRAVKISLSWRALIGMLGGGLTFFLTFASA